MKLAVMVLACIPLLAACSTTTPQERAARDAAELAEVQNTCTGYGFTRGTEAHASCVMQLQNPVQYAAPVDSGAPLRQLGQDLMMGTQRQTCTYNTFGMTTTQTCR